MSPTPPSTTSSSAFSPEGQYRVIRKRNRVPLSCGPCRHRKLKCNRAHPCENCVKRGDSTSCTYAQANARKKNIPQRASPSSPDDMQNRIDRLESLVLSLMTNGSQSAGPAAAMAAISGNSSSIGSAQHTIDLDVDEETSGGPEESDTEQVTKSFGIMKVDNNKSYYISDAHWASVLNDIAEVRNYFSTHKKQYEEQAEKLKTTRVPTDVPGSTLLFGAMKTTSRPEIMASLPSKYTTDMLVARYFNSYDPSTNILHGPTFQTQYNKHWEDPSQTCVVWIGMLCAIMRLAMLSYHREGDEPPELRGKTLDMAGTFRNLMAQCLTLADYTKPYPYLVESLIFHLHGDFIQTKDAEVSVWVLVGVIARLAMRMGYHRDSKMFPNITPFQGEMRRRVWTIVRQYDLMFSFQVGLPSMIRSSDSDTELPRNLYDDDFDENCQELPPSRPPNEPTPVSCLISKGRLTYAFGHVIEHTSSIQSPSYDKVMEIDAELRRARDLIPEHLLVRPVEDAQLEPPKLVTSRFAIMSVYHKAQCLLHRRYLIRARENPRFTYSRRTCIDSAMELLRFQSMLHAETTGRLRNKHDRLAALVSTDFLLAATIVSMDLYHGHQLQTGGLASGDTYAWGRERREEMIAAIQRSKDIWDELRDDAMEAWKASGALGVMLARLNLGFSDSNPSAAAFEPQDEKQSAAMTLGLLSSGMSPMNPGPAFTDGAVKMGETPLPAHGGYGMTTDMAGAPSPLNAMFGQMPDMQLHLDWDAWDSYIQNATIDVPNQWWPTMDPHQQQQQQQQQQSPLVSAGLQAAQNGSSDKLRSLPPFSRWNSQHVPTESDQASNDTAQLIADAHNESVINAAGGYIDGTPSTVAETANEPTAEPVTAEGGEAQSEPDTKAAKRQKLMANQPAPNETLWVANIFYDVTAEDLRTQFEKYGVVERVQIIYDDRGISKGYAYILFDTIESATRAKNAMHMKIFEGRRVFINYANTPLETSARRPKPPSKTIYLGNMPFEMTDRDLNDLFSDVLNVIDVRVNVDRRTGMFKGYAHAEFTNIQSAVRGYDILSRKAPYGRKLRLDYSHSKKADALEQV
ncbi:hypothetical protein BDV25DRAFT_131245 [Aspergillus avenaceus]|uniref:C6 transcription factor n=1 Tax=Aspergillus avenaceus TaxID=36643 RepID=A0A5N6TQ54_ASPAV|nr:hypothetical protein BDV25DRAFT_131245 [Aspergillus avenaceus]